MMRRRQFITLIGGAAASWPWAAGAQQPAMPVIGFLGSASADLWAARVRAFRQGLSEVGYVDGRNVAIEYRWAEGQYDQLPTLAADLVRRQVAVIVAPASTPAALAAKAATTTIPIVFQFASDPIELGLVDSLARPGGNITGIMSLNVEVGPKRLELLREVIPTATDFALLVNPTDRNLAEVVERDLQTAAGRLGLKLHVLHASAERDFDTVFATLARLRPGGLVIGNDAFFTSRSEQLAALALRNRVPAIYWSREFAAGGGLMSYGAGYVDVLRMTGVYAGRILKGEKPADLPVQQGTKIELVINLKTAKALGLTVPLPLLGRAEEVIE